MWKTLAVVAALGLAPVQAYSFTLTNVRTTYGVLGLPRPNNEFLPGDSFVLSFNLEGIKSNEDGKFLYRIAMEVVDDNGKVQFKQDPRDMEANNTLGGTKLPAFAELNIGTEQPPGKYTMKVTVTDRVGKTSQSVSRPFEIVKKTFGLVRLRLTNDPDGVSSAIYFGEGELLWVNFAAVGFERKGDKEQPDLAVELRVLDEEGKPTSGKPLTGEVNKDISPKMKAVPMQFVLELNRPGKFKVEIKAKDRNSGKTATLSFPLNVLGMK